MVAFVVGVGNYKVHNDLKNPVPDAEAIKGVLESHGVEVFYVHDCNSKEFWHEFELFQAVIQPGDAVFFYFAGHGCTYRNSVRLMTICNSGKADIEKDGINFNYLLARSATASCNECLRCHDP